MEESSRKVQPAVHVDTMVEQRAAVLKMLAGEGNLLLLGWRDVFADDRILD